MGGGVQGTQESSRKASYAAKLASQSATQAMYAKQTAQGKLNKALESGNAAKIKDATKAYNDAVKTYNKAQKDAAKAQAKSKAETMKWMSTPEYKMKYHGHL